MAELMTIVSQELDKWPQWQQSSRILLAISGGLDSRVLLDLILKINQTLAQPKQIMLAHFNHRLRQEADQDAAFVRDLAQELGLPYFIKAWDQPAERNIEAQARQARYTFFADIIKQEEIDSLMTGHHLNDLAETVLMRLTRGTSLRGLGGIQANYVRHLTTSDHTMVQVQIMRPLLTVKKESLYHYAQQEDLIYLEDPSNYDDRYFRNRMRHQILPLLIQENPNFLENVLALQDQVQTSYRLHYHQYLMEEPHLLMYSDQMKWVLYVPALADLTVDKRKIYLTLFFEERLVEVVPTYTKEAIERLDAMIVNDRLPNASFQLNEEWEVRREYDYIYIQPKHMIVPAKGQEIRRIHQLNHWHQIDADHQAGLFDERYFSTAAVQAMDYHIRLYLTPDQLRGFYLRHRMAGDRLLLNDGPSGDVFHKKVSRLMIDHKVPTNDRDKLWILCDEKDQVLSVLGYIASRHYRYRHPQADPYLFLYRKRTQDQGFD